MRKEKKISKRPRFLQTITAFGNDVLVPIDRIKFVYVTYKECWELHITSDDGDWVECFDKNVLGFEDAEEKLDKRYTMIKNILGAE